MKAEMTAFLGGRVKKGDRDRSLDLCVLAREGKSWGDWTERRGPADTLLTAISQA